jgi:hypothetical protein
MPPDPAARGWFWRIARLASEAEQAARRFIRRIDACLDLKISALSCKKNAHRKTRYFVILLVPTKTDKDSALGIVYKPRGIQEIFASRLTG